MVGGPAQMDLYDYKPKMRDWYDKDLPESIRNGQRLTTMTSGQSRFPIAPSKYRFDRHGIKIEPIEDLIVVVARGLLRIAGKVIRICSLEVDPPAAVTVRNGWWHTL